MCCVIPPASPSITLVFLIASSKEVLPWSTCPITTTTGGRGFKSSSLSSESSNRMSSSLTCSFLTAVTPNASANKYAVSKSKSWFIFAIIPRSNNFLITSALVFFNSAAKSLTEIFSGIVISLSSKIFCLFLSSFFLIFFFPFLPLSVVKS